MSLLRRFAGGGPKIFLGTGDQQSESYFVVGTGTVWVQVAYALLPNGVARFESTRSTDSNFIVTNSINWLRAGVAADYDVKYVGKTGPSNPAGSLSTTPSMIIGNFYNLGTNRVWTHYLPSSSLTETSTCSISIEIYHTTDHTKVLNSATLTTSLSASGTSSGGGGGGIDGGGGGEIP